MLKKTEKQPASASCCCCCCVASVVSNSVRPHRWQPTGLRCPWDSPGKNTGVGCHFLLQCVKVKSESEVAQSCLTRDTMDCSLLGSSVHGICQARVLEWVATSMSYPTPREHLSKTPASRGTPLNVTGQPGREGSWRRMDTSISLRCSPETIRAWLICYPPIQKQASLVTQMVKNLACSAGDLGSIPGSGRSPGEGNGNPLQYSCLENPTDRGAWWATAHGVAKSQA